eukprot:2252319-Amphidinium_carterae.1
MLLSGRHSEFRGECSFAYEHGSAVVLFRLIIACTSFGCGVCANQRVSISLGGGNSLKAARLPKRLQSATRSRFFPSMRIVS